MSAESESEKPKLAYGINELSEATGFGRSTIRSLPALFAPGNLEPGPSSSRTT
jgi:hypothetical protein